MDEEHAPAGKGLAASPGALAGLKVIDLTRVLGGPYCTMILSDHGAEVIKIEPPQGDEVRDWGPPFHDGDASYFIGINRNKRSIALDLGKPEGRAVLLRLLEGADVLIENFKPGSMEKWGLGYEKDLSPRFPGLIHCRISGFGADGPLGGLPGYDAILQAMTGLMSVNGDRHHRADAPRHRDRRHGHRALFRHRHPDGAARTQAIRPRPVPRHDAVRLRHGAAASAGGQFLPQRQAPGRHRQPASRTWCPYDKFPTQHLRDLHRVAATTASSASCAN